VRDARPGPTRLPVPPAAGWAAGRPGAVAAAPLIDPGPSQHIAGGGRRRPAGGATAVAAPPTALKRHQVQESCPPVSPLRPRSWRRPAGCSVIRADAGN